MGLLVVDPSECALGLGVDFDLFHIHRPNAELEQGIPVVFGQVVAIHELDDVGDGFFPGYLELFDESMPEEGEVLLADFVAVAG